MRIPTMAGGALAVLATITLPLVGPIDRAAAYTREAAPLESSADVETYGLASDCVLKHYNACSCWTWVFNDGPGAEWGSVFDPDECPGGCASGGSLTDIWFFSKCVTPPAVPRTIGGVFVHAVDAMGCRTALLWSSGPLSVTHCTGTDQWTHVVVPEGAATFSGNPFCVSVRWGPIVSGGSTRFQLVSDNGVANLYCSQGVIGLPGCFTASCGCAGWSGMIPPQRSFIYVQDYDHDGDLDDLCAALGAPYPISFPYVAPYGYMPNNLLIRAELKCTVPASVDEPQVEQNSWGHVKALFE